MLAIDAAETTLRGQTSWRWPPAKTSSASALRGSASANRRARAVLGALLDHVLRRGGLAVGPEPDRGAEVAAEDRAGRRATRPGNRQDQVAEPSGPDQGLVEQVDPVGRSHQQDLLPLPPRGDPIELVQ